MVNVYVNHGFKNRKKYLEHLADEYALPIEVVTAIAQMLGPDEDFDGLITMLEDAVDSGEFDY
jgi:hypothetical protein